MSVVRRAQHVLLMLVALAVLSFVAAMWADTPGGGVPQDLRALVRSEGFIVFVVSALYLTDMIIIGA